MSSAKTRGRFITLEGVEGAGKSTNLRVISDALEQRQIEFIQTREPGGTEIAERIRELLLAQHQESMQDMTELLLVFAARSQHLEAVIKPAMERGSWVLCDRFTDATFAYQGYGRGLDVTAIEALQTLVQGDLRPDLTVILDLEPEVGLGRAQQRGELDRFEREELQFFNRVRAGYLSLCEQQPRRCRCVDAAGSEEQVRQRLQQLLDECLPRLLEPSA